MQFKNQCQSDAYLKSIINTTCAKENKVQISCKNDDDDDDDDDDNNKIKGK